MNPVVTVMFSLIKSEVFSTPLDDGIKNSITPKMANELYMLSTYHDVAAIIASAINRHGLFGEDPAILQKFDLQAISALYRHEHITYDLDAIRACFAERKIEFIPLKGAVIRKYYQTPQFRSSCDIDILVHKSDVERAADALSENLGFKKDGKSLHDVSLTSSKKVHVELHHSLIEDSRAGGAAKVLAHFWDYARPTKIGGYEYEVADDVFYLYHIAHIAKHFTSGGCGIRPILDLYILDNFTEHDRSARDKLLDDAGLLTFANYARRLAAVWFGSDGYDETTRKMQTFILKGGAFGNLENYVTARQNKQGGRARLVLKKLFPSFADMSLQYPILKKWAILIPVMYAWRWISLFTEGRAKNALREVQKSNSLTDAQATELKRLFDTLEI